MTIHRLSFEYLMASIESLRTRAGQAGDMVQVAICSIALGEGYDPSLTDGQRSLVDLATLTQEKARAMCRSVLDEHG